jgi:cytochrome c
MVLLQWKDEYSVGIEAVDYEHKELIDLINRLYARLDAPDAKLTVPAFFGDLLRGISAHFALEEKQMREYGYDRLASHKEDHERLLDELRDIMDAFERAAEVDSVELAQRLDIWFTRHFKTHDARLHHALGPHAQPAADHSASRPQAGIGKASLIAAVMVGAAAVAAPAASALAADVAAGETSFKKCLVCHAVGEGAKNKVGPVLNGLDGRKSGTIEGFSYSPANKNSGIVWDEKTFLEYIKDPKAKIPGTKMVFVGIKNEKEAEDLWAYLNQFGPDGKKK